MKPKQKVMPFLVSYKGGKIAFTPRYDVEGNHTGYYFTCPQCKARGRDAPNAIDTTPGHWTVRFDEHGATLDGSILCRSVYGRSECGWHVLIENGTARDA